LLWKPARKPFPASARINDHLGTALHLPGRKNLPRRVAAGGGSLLVVCQWQGFSRTRLLLTRPFSAAARIRPGSATSSPWRQWRRTKRQPSLAGTRFAFVGATIGISFERADCFCDTPAELQQVTAGGSSGSTPGSPASSTSSRTNSSNLNLTA
jgi:hypothetical protein